MAALRSLTAASVLVGTAMFAGSAHAALIFEAENLPAPVAVDFSELVIDLTGVESVDALDDPDNVYMTFDIGAGSHITEVSWDFTYEAFSPSWLSEATILFGSSDGLDGVAFTPFLGEDSPGVMSTSGAADLVDLGLDFSVVDGLLVLQFYESFADGIWDNLADGMYQQGSLTITYSSATGPVVPEPATWMMLVGGLGLAGALMRRSRGSAQVSFS